MTDYGQFYDRDDKPKSNPVEETKKKEKRKRKRVDKVFEQVVLGSDKKTTCSANSSLVAYAKHLKTVKAALKAAAADGFCLDEIMDGLKELGDE